MRLPRFRVRTLMIMVAGVAFALVAIKASERAYYYWRLSISYDDMSKSLAEGVPHYLQEAKEEEDKANVWDEKSMDGFAYNNEIAEFVKSSYEEMARECRERAKESRKNAADDAETSRRYRRVARRPWEPVPADLCQPSEMEERRRLGMSP